MAYNNNFSYPGQQPAPYSPPPPQGGGGGFPFNPTPGGADEMMLKMGLQYGTNYIESGLKKGEEGILSYMPFISNLHCYFAVTNAYVKKKLGLICFPFLNKFPPSEDDSSSAFSVANNNNFGNTGGNPPPMKLPSQDYYVNDLYIPTMAATTYVILSAVAFGLIHGSPVTAEYLFSTITAVVVWYLLELAVIKVASMALLIVHPATVLDLCAICGYKYVLICVALLIRLTIWIERSFILFSVLATYILLANSFLSFGLIKRQGSGGTVGGRPVARARLLALIIVAVQIPSTVWMLWRPFKV
ncbi:Hrf1 family protein [Angomonas deanei]|uniref:Protein YIF1 n=1 Tax=Angomonas deanei TaxID=59799 RepID=A0A7G2C845_9TRYP|nr:Hrf1 family protein [Angomonas deanei]CAD2215201.1 YIF1, putative [Angomonas deanei]|eukprot:EPY39050.1 Hrf1 family protein [Angomonas deanei]